MPRTIKKYANRRLYDTTASRHVTLQDILKLVASGEEITVVDDTSGDDITRNILLQILAEQEQGGRPILSTEMLMQIIRFYGNPMQGHDDPVSGAEYRETFTSSNSSSLAGADSAMRWRRRRWARCESMARSQPGGLERACQKLSSMQWMPMHRTSRAGKNERRTRSKALAHYER